MGIHGIYKEIGPGLRIALSKLAVQKFEETGRPLRIAVDVSIWLFQIQASKGGTNPALRTFYYRLLRLTSLSIHPIFVFDGPDKPPFKRGKRTGPNVASVPNFLAKQLLKQFGFPIHHAPGEAEAECALLQREGIVDAVVSEDVDTLMFGSGVTIRNWSPEQKSSKTPTHVNVYDAVKIKNGQSGLDREGMILVALMSGGDYVPEGIPKVGPKIACEAARAGFGSELCKIRRNDRVAIREWRERLQHELKTNESKYFSRKHKALVIPEDFPRTDIMGYYTHPSISNQAGLERLRRSLKWDQDLDFPGLREFTKDAFDWAKLEGAKHFIRSLAPSLLVRGLRMRGEGEKFRPDDLRAIQEDEELLVKGIHGKRQHMTTDHTTELRVSFTPIELVKIDLTKEDPDDEQTAQEAVSETAPEGNGDDPDLDVEAMEIEDDEADKEGKKRPPTKFNPHEPYRIWVLETYVKIGVPLKAEDWEASRTRPKKSSAAAGKAKAAPKARGSKKANNSAPPPQRTIDTFAKVTKPGVRAAQTLGKLQSPPRQPAATKSSRQEEHLVIELLSSSPVKTSTTTTTRTTSSRSSTSTTQVPDELPLPSSVTKRRRKKAIERAHTDPVGSCIFYDRPSTPPLPTVIDTLNLVSSPVIPSPIPMPAKKAKTNIASKAPTPRGTPQKPPMSSPSKGRQMTLDDAWALSSPAPSPTKYRIATPKAHQQPPPSFNALHVGVTILDLTTPTVERKKHQGPQQRRSPRNTRRTSASPPIRRPALKSITSNSSISTVADSDDANKLKTTTSTSSRQTPPYPISLTTQGTESLDLTFLSSPPSSPPPVAEVTSTTSLRRSPRAHNTPDSASPPNQKPPREPSPPAAWKTQLQKKRLIRLRQSVPGSWDFDEVDTSSPKTVGDEQKEIEKSRRKWRESNIPILDLVD